MCGVCRSAVQSCIWATVVTMGVVSLVVGSDGLHPLFQAIERGDTALLRSLLRQGAEVNICRPDGTTPLMYAALLGSADDVRMLLAHNADATAANQRGVTALLWGAGDIDKVRMLLEHDANVNARSALGNTPLTAAAAHPGGREAVALMLEHGADPGVRNRRSIGALQLALTVADADTVDLLLSDPRVMAQQGGKFVEEFVGLLRLASESGSEQVLDRLMDFARQRGEEALVRDRLSLHDALIAQHPRVACRLIEYGAKLDDPTPAGRVPPIMLATYTETGDTSVLQLMLSRGVDVNAQNDAQETALTWARRRGHTELIEMLTHAGTPEAPEDLPEIPGRSLNLHAGNQQRLIREAVQKSLNLMQASSDRFLEERANCVSCHHQNLPGVALGWARDRGYQVDEAVIQRMIQRQVRDWAPRVDRAFEMDIPGPVVERFFGYGLWSLAELGWADRTVTEPFVYYLAATQQPDGRWIAGMMRPPMGGGDVTATVLAMRALQLYPLASRTDELQDRVRRAADWLARWQPRYPQERALKLLGMAWAGRSTDELAAQIEPLLATQHAEGGWSQLENLPPDAWATGQAMVALYSAGMPTTHPAYQHAVEFVLRTQFEDGSWFVKSRTWPFQPPFESGFPFGRDQWISIGGTAWAVMGLVLASESSGPMTAAAGAPATATVEEPPAAKVDFVTQIKPLLERSCAECHQGAEPAGGFRVTDRNSLLAGGESGWEAIVPGNSAASRLVDFVAGRVEAMEMPPRDRRQEFPALSEQEQLTLRAWIDQGANGP